MHGQFNWISPKNLSTEQQYHRQKMRKQLEIEKAKENKRRKVLNRNDGNLVKTNTWTPLFVKLPKKKPTQRLHVKFKNDLIASCISFTFGNGFDKRSQNITLTVVILISFVIYSRINGDVIIEISNKVVI